MTAQDSAVPAAAGDTHAEAAAAPKPRLTLGVRPESAAPQSIVALEISLDGLAADRHAGRTVAFYDAEGVLLTRAELTPESGCLELGIEPVEVAAPAAPGLHRWSAVLEDPDAPEDAEPLVAEFALTVSAHQPSLSVWDIPPAIPRGTGFRLRLGIKCPHGCASHGWSYAIRDHEGRLQAQGQVGAEAWPGTEGLCHAEVALTAPDATGGFDWQVTATAAEDAPCPHVPREQLFRLHSVPRPEHVLRVEVVDAETQAPVDNARVVVHPYRAVTDAQGVAELRLPAGEHTLFVSGRQYFSFKSVGLLNDDQVIRVEMYVDRPFTHADAWA